MTSKRRRLRLAQGKMWPRLAPKVTWSLQSKARLVCWTRAGFPTGSNSIERSMLSFLQATVFPQLQEPSKPQSQACLLGRGSVKSGFPSHRQYNMGVKLQGSIRRPADNANALLSIQFGTGAGEGRVVRARAKGKKVTEGLSGQVMLKEASGQDNSERRDGLTSQQGRTRNCCRQLLS